MASAIIHMAVAKAVGDIIDKNSNDYFLGSIAPDISKIVGKDRAISHFEEDGMETPNIEKFIKKYQKYIEQDFELGYLIHLYTDEYWIKHFIPTIKGDQQIKLLDGTIITYPKEKILDLIYNDYTTVNISTIEDHDLDLSLFYDIFPFPKTVIEEVPKDFRKLIDKMGIIIENSKQEKQYLFDQNQINLFIEECSLSILNELRQHHIILA